MPSPTMRDVARHAGVDASTVSRALNESTRQMISEETVQRVLRAARELGYRTNSLARGLRTQRSLTVGMLIPDLTNPFFPPIVRGIEDGLAVDGYRLLLVNTDNDEVKEHELLQALLERQVDGVVLATSHLDRPAVDPLDTDQLAVVMVNRTSEDPTVSSVVPDDDAGVAAVVDHLADLGHVRVAHVAGPQALSTGRRRAQSHREQVRRRGLDTDEHLVQVADSFTVEAGEAACRRLLESDVGCTAIVAGNDLIAIGCMGALEAHGVRVPEDVSLVGYNDMPFVDRLRPALTTVRVPQYEMGRQAARLVLQELAGQTGPEHLQLLPELVVRRSTCPATS